VSISDPIAKITRLLRIADRHPDTDEGKTARAIAERLMLQHGVEVDLSEVDDPDASVASTESQWIDVGVYDRRDGWRARLADAIGVMFGVVVGWRGTVDGQAGLGMTDPELDADHLVAAISYFYTLERIVMSVPIPRIIPTTLGMMHVAPDDPRVSTLIRRGVSDAILEYLGRLPPIRSRPSNDVVVEDADVVQRSTLAIEGEPATTESVSMVRIRRITVPRHEEIQTIPPPIPIADEFAGEATSDEARIYSMGVLKGRRLHIPRP